MATDAGVLKRLHPQLSALYADRTDVAVKGVSQLLEKYAATLPQKTGPRWTERDVVLIAYGDQVQKTDKSSLAVLAEFLETTSVDQLVNTVHILPFCPYSSDDGFSVIDFRQIDPKLGHWQDLKHLGQRVELMFDLVLNHVSQKSEWFQQYLAGKSPYDQFFIEVEPDVDLKDVTRPRSTPLLTPFETSRGVRHVWTTFSADQVDLNYACPELLIEMLDVLFYYVQQGARIIRLDAIAYLWKVAGTSCIHLQQTHEFIRIVRKLMDSLAPHVLLLTETNVPHEENVSYFGLGDEAHMVYQFSLPPLLLDAILSHDSGTLTRWLGTLGETPQGTTYFNFTASHDGIGVRPLEGLVSPQRLQRLADAAKACGGVVSNRRKPDGSNVPYELNVTYWDALGNQEPESPEVHVRRFLASQAIMLALRGVPGIYFHSLVGTPNDSEGAAESGQPRRINRRKYQFDELLHRLRDSGSTQAKVFAGYKHLLATRIQQPAFHPDGAQQVLEFHDPAILGFLRTSPDESQKILVLANLSDSSRKVDLAAHFPKAQLRDLVKEPGKSSPDPLPMEPYQVAWLDIGG